MTPGKPGAIPPHGAGDAGQNLPGYGRSLPGSAGQDSPVPAAGLVRQGDGRQARDPEGAAGSRGAESGRGWALRGRAVADCRAGPIKNRAETATTG
ncbi:protein of unknown function [Azospirillum lipoferum 4B]|uniref:Uncharacterized protein n=1 Tax=Azospirillum lipoferum (strain 4B) TaxID=862719 RepID=G7Z5F6_AZOL4|nr:protein of unknown function [Azospirillum lipoferum 4B]